jgi:hypothetical protein
MAVGRKGVKIVHKKIKAEAEVQPESLHVWLDKGWTLADAGSKAVAKKAADIETASADEKN